jgi:hypothetical protein
MSGHFRSVSLLVALIVPAGVGLWATRAAAPPAAAQAPAAPKKEKRIRLGDTRLRDALKKTIDFKGNDDPKLTLIEFLNFLSERHDVSFDVNEKAFNAEGYNDVLKTEITANNTPLPPMSKTTLRKVLMKALARLSPKSGATFLIRKDAIEITTEAAVREELDLPAPKNDEEKAPPLPPLVWEEFTDEPLEDALREIAHVMDATILIDPRASTKAATKIDATLRNVPLDTSLTLLCDMAGLAVVKRHNAYYVTTPENAERLRSSKKEK